MQNRSYANSEEYRQRQRERAKRWYYEHRDQVLREHKKDYDSSKESVALKVVENRNHWKGRAYERLGNKCVRCGFNNPMALQLDHVAGGGSQIMRASRTRSYSSYYRDIALAPDGIEKHIQILCCNCNMIKRYTEDVFFA